METPAELADRFDRRAPEYDGSAMHRGLAQAVADFVRLGGVRDVLDVGTGTGLVLRSLPAGPWRLRGVDLSPGMVDVARAALPDAEFAVADATSLDLPDASVDLVTCVTMLHLVPDAPAAMREWRRVLRPGGCLVLATFADDSPSWHGPAPEPGHSPAEAHAPLGSSEALERLAAASGFVVSRIAEWELRSNGGAPEYRCLITEFAPVDDRRA
ncbi:ubiquinone/menaquinone biosynthesis C-methylase UbiE [Agromyces sp. 3263]|uniref:class I SAM-dependent methyltransferase n=1 Tax=Agromyces sp. 3263 TaxID=2817750 RepID=UPI0028585610|nr:class I SAM-dependent methyltransferase [Agromyces sp. 3263]MDR6905846.1 ubiquinone/menaquinone biosynthesis C-methylase UbiE [Agromyces sp. 3263]